MDGGDDQDAARLQALVTLEHDWTQAWLESNFDRVREILAPEFSITTAGWVDEPIGLDEWLDAVSKTHVLEAFEYDQFRLRSIGPVALLQCRCRQRGHSEDGASWDMVFRYTDVWLESSGTWQLVMRHASGRRA